MRVVENRKILIAITTLFVAIGIALIPPPAGLSPKAMAMIGITVLALVYWSTECVPIPVTGLIIIALITLWGISPVNRSILFIADDVNILVLAGLVIAVALSKYGVDKYVALRLLSVMGERSDRIILGLMLSVAAISMWIPNTAAAAIMAPVAAGILNLVGAEKGRSNIGKVAMLGVAYAASIGGIATPVGTPPVPITIRNVEKETGIHIGFATWMAWGVPLSLVLVLVAWYLLTKIFKPEVQFIAGSRNIVEVELEKIGGMKGLRRKALVLFLVAVALWLLNPLMDPLMKRGAEFSRVYLAVLSVLALYLAVTMAILVYTIATTPVRRVIYLVALGKVALFVIATVLKLSDMLTSGRSTEWTYLVSPLIILIFLLPGTRLLNWRDVTGSVDWGTLYLVAGGLALGSGLRATGLVDAISSTLATVLGGSSPVVVLVVVGLISSFAITVFCSITATSATMVPIAIGIARALGVHPLIAAVVAGVASCYAFLLPANTPPNAIAYSYGYFKSYEMAKTGTILILVSITIALPFVLTVVPLVMNVSIIA